MNDSKPGAAFALRDEIALYPWQRAAHDAWVGGDAYRGTLAIYTGGGKTVIALACAATAATNAGAGFRLVIVVPTVALAEQWEAVVRDKLRAPPFVVRMRGGSLSPSQAEKAGVVIAVINSAATLRDALGDGARTMLVVDECHRAGAPSFRAALDIPARYRLGLSATPERDDLDEAGEPIAYADQIVAQKLGDVVFRFGLAEARANGFLPEYTIEHHALELDAPERAEYERRTHQVDAAADRLRSVGIAPGRARGMQGRAGEAGVVARGYLGALAKRKDLVFHAVERNRVAYELIAAALAEPANKVLAFNERIAEAEALYARVRERFGDAVALEHSQLPTKARTQALQAFRAGTARVLISAKSLIEGIDVPDATVGISVASTASVRQRIQSIGRVLRNAPGKRAAMHVLYVRDTVDETIYQKENWSDLTGEEANLYEHWPLGASAPLPLAGPPHVPRPTEAEEHARLGACAFPTPWNGMLDGREYSVDTKGSVRNALGASIANPQNVAAMIADLRGARGGRFVVTPTFRYVIASKWIDDAAHWFALGRLATPFAAVARAEAETARPARDGTSKGTFRIRPIGGGTIERRNADGSKVIARTAGDDPAARNARTVIARWRALAITGVKFFVGANEIAWFDDAGTVVELGAVPGGFAFPDA